MRGSTFRVFLPYQPIAAKTPGTETAPTTHGAVLVADYKRDDAASDRR